MQARMRKGAIRKEGVLGWGNRGRLNRNELRAGHS